MGFNNGKKQRGMENMIRLQDIADMAGVSRTTVSNVINGKTKRVSLATIERVTKILDEQSYIPNMGSKMLTGQKSKIIGVVLGFSLAHGMHALQDAFVSEFLGTIQEETEKAGYFLMLIGGDNYKNVVDIASRWNIEGLIILSYPGERYKKLHKELNKKIVMVDAYPEGEYTFQNVGIDDYSGGYQVGEYLHSCGYDKALFLAETTVESDYYRWKGFKKAMEKDGRYCSKSRFLLIPRSNRERLRKYTEWLPKLLEAEALAFSSDYTAIEAMNFLHDNHIRVPEQISIVGYDDCMYSEYVRPRLTTIHQDVHQKAVIAFQRLMKMINGETLEEMDVKSPVYLVKRESVKEGRNK